MQLPSIITSVRGYLHRPRTHYHIAIALLSALYVLCYHRFFFSSMALHTRDFEHPLVLIISIAIALWAFLAFVFECITAQWSSKAVCLIITIIASISALYMDTYQVSISPAIIDALVHTNLREASDLITPKMIALWLIYFLPALLLIHITHPKASFKIAPPPRGEILSPNQH